MMVQMKAKAGCLQEGENWRTEEEKSNRGEDTAASMKLFVKVHEESQW